jgi:hypothetical protein
MSIFLEVNFVDPTYNDFDNIGIEVNNWQDVLPEIKKRREQYKINPSYTIYNIMEPSKGFRYITNEFLAEMAKWEKRTEVLAIKVRALVSIGAVGCPGDVLDKLEPSEVFTLAWLEEEGEMDPHVWVSSLLRKEVD